MMGGWMDEGSIEKQETEESRVVDRKGALLNIRPTQSAEPWL